MDIEKLKKKYPKVNVRVELEKIENYLEYSGKKYKNYLRFAYNWLQGETEKIEKQEQRQLRYENEKKPKYEPPKYPVVGARKPKRVGKPTSFGEALQQAM